MADGRTRAAAAGDDDGKGADTTTPPAAAEEAKVEDPTFPRERLLDESRAFFGEPVWHVAAGLATLPANKKNFTVAEVQAAIKTALATEVS